MKKWIGLVLAVILSGCGAEDPAMRETLELRSRVLGVGEVTFRACLTAHYIDTRDQFALDCRVDGDGVVSFTAEKPEQIAGITGTVSGTEGALTFDETVLAFPLITEEGLSPVSAPWVMMQALRAGYIISAVQEGELLHMTIDDSYGSDALTVDLWARGGTVVSAEISREGRRVIVLEIDHFTLL